MLRKEPTCHRVLEGNQGQPIVTRRAKLFKNVLRKTPIAIFDGE